MTQVTFKKYDINGKCENFHDSSHLTKTIYSNGEVVIDRCPTCGARMVTSEYQLPSWINEISSKECYINGDMQKLEKWVDDYLSDDEFTDNYEMSDLTEEIFNSCDSFDDSEIITVGDDVEFGILLGRNDISYKQWEKIKKQFQDNGYKIKIGDKVAFTSSTAWLIRESDIFVLCHDTEE